MVRIGGFSSPRVTKVGKRCPPPKRKTKGIVPAVDTGKSECSPSRSSPVYEFPSMGLFSGASNFDTLVDDFDLQWDLACHDLHDSEFRSMGCLDDNFISNGDLASRAPEASKSSPMCCEAPLHSQLQYNMNEPLSTNENSHNDMATSEPSVKDPFSPVAWTADIEADDNSSSCPLHVIGSTPPQGIVEMVPAPRCFQTSPSPPPLSKSCVGYSADSKPISRVASSWKDQRLPSQQTVVDNPTHGNDSSSEKPTRGGRHRRNRTQASQGRLDGDTKQGSTSKAFSKKYAVILGRDFLLINRTLQSSLKTAKAFRFFHRPSISPVVLRGKIDSPTDPMNCDSEDFVTIPSPIVGVGKVAICDPVPMSASLQTVLQPSNLVEPPIRIEASLMHPGSEVRNLGSKRITACWDNNFEISINHVETRKPKCTLAFKDNNSVECGHLMARSALKLLRPTRTIRAFQDNSATKIGHHMASPSKRKANRQKPQLKDRDEALSVQAFKPCVAHKRKRVHTIEDSCNEPHVFRAPQRRALH